MRLKNKKTGKIEDLEIRLLGTDPDRFVNSIAELNEEYEDAPEEIKPFEEMAKAKHRLDFSVVGSPTKTIKVADIDYYEILPDGTKKTEFTWDEAMEIEKKTHGKWRVPTVPEIFAICAAFGQSEDGTDVDPQILVDNLGVTTNEDGHGYYWSAATYNTDYSRYLYFGASSLGPRTGDYKGFGFAVRCVAAQ